MIHGFDWHTVDLDGARQMIYTTDLLTIQDAINAIRNAFDTSGRRTTFPPEMLEREYLKFEAARFRFSNQFMEARRHNRGRLADSIVNELYSDLIDLLRDESFAKLAFEIRIVRRVRPRNNPFASDLIAILDVERYVSVHEFIERLVSALYGGIIYDEEVAEKVLENSGRSLDASRLKSIVPEQKVAPVQFDIENGKLLVRAQHHNTAPGRDSIVTVALQEILRRGDNLVAELRNSNCDRRLLQNIEELQDHLKDSDNVIQIGLSCLACDQLAKAFSKELPDATSALLLAHTSSVSMYLSQFTDWRTFSEASDRVEMSSVDVSALSQTLGQVIAAFQEDLDIADPEVPRTLSEIQSLLANPKEVAKRAALAAARTLENLVIRIFGFGAEYIEQSIQKSVDQLSTVTSKIIAISLLSAALVAATNLSALGGSVEG